MKVVIDGNKTKTVRGNRATELLEHISALFTKEEVIAMLEEIQAEIDEESWTIEWPDGITERKVEMRSVSKIIQQKIDKVRGENGEKG